MTPDIKPLNPKTAAGHGWKPARVLAAIGDGAFCPIAVDELTAALSLFPLAFIPAADQHWRMAAVLGLHPGENLMLSPEGRWLAPYLPGPYRTYPFFLQYVRVEDETHAVLSFDHASGLYTENPRQDKGDQLFFDGEGKLTPLTQRIAEALRIQAEGQLKMNKAADALAAAKLLEPWTWQIDNPDPERPLLQGLYRIREEALAAMSGRSLKALRDVGALAIAYAQIFSQIRVNALLRQYVLHPPSPMKDTLDMLKSLSGGNGNDNLFGDGNDGDIRFFGDR